MKRENPVVWVWLGMPLAWKLAFQHGESLSHNSRTNTDTADLGLGVLALSALPILQSNNVYK
jgi:hypothetical protein